MSVRHRWDAARYARNPAPAACPGAPCGASLARRPDPFQDGARRRVPGEPSNAPRAVSDGEAADESGGVAQRALAAVVDGLEHGVVVADSDGRVLILNRTARELLARGPLHLRNGRLQARTPREAAALRGLIARCAGDEGGGATRLGDEDGDRPIMALATPLRLPGGSRPAPGWSTEREASGREASGLVVVLLVDPFRHRSADAALLRAQFDLTPAEAALAAEVLHGDGLPACARRLGIRASTARTHLQRVFEKTGTRRQAELVRLLLLCHRLPGEERGSTG